jgi:phage tail tape-measure protein
MEGKAETDLQGNVISTAGSKVGNIVGNKVGGKVGSLISKQTKNQLTKLGKSKKGTDAINTRFERRHLFYHHCF